MTRLFAGTPFDRPPVCDRCGLLEAACECPPAAPAKTLVPPEKQTVTLRTEKRAKGKVVTVIRGLAAAENDLPALLTKLKNHCGAGGAIDGDVLEVQGDHAQKLKTWFSQQGYKVRG
jgi:translation initiation factor 1